MQEPPSCFARCSALPGVWEEQECSGEGQRWRQLEGGAGRDVDGWSCCLFTEEHTRES